jgi:ATP-dependent Lon protease
MQAEIEILQVEKKIRTRVKKQMEKTQKDYYLNEQMQAIQKELGDRDEFKNESKNSKTASATSRCPKRPPSSVKKELRKLKMMSPMSAEATVVRNYIDWILSLPWFDTTEDKLDIREAENILDEDHYGLEKPKERILEYLAVQSPRPTAPRTHPLPRRPPRRRQDLPRPLHRQEPPAASSSASQPRRRPRRGRDPRPPPHLHRRHARQDHPKPQKG